MNPNKILLVEDDDDDAFFIRKMLPVKTEVVQAKTLSSARQLLGEINDWQLILLDLTLPDSQASNTFVALAEQELDIPVVILTGMIDDDLINRAINSGIDDYIIKDEITTESLGRAITKATIRKEKERRIRTLNERQIAVLRELADQVFKAWTDLALSQLRLIEKFSQGETVQTVEIVEAMNHLMEYTSHILTDLHQALNPTLSDTDRMAFLTKVLDTIHRQ